MINSIYFRLICLFIIAHIISFIVEVVRYKSSHYNLKHFLKNEMTVMSYFLLLIDTLILIAVIFFWAMQPIIEC